MGRRHRHRRRRPTPTPTLAGRGDVRPRHAQPRGAARARRARGAARPLGRGVAGRARRRGYGRTRSTDDATATARRRRTPLSTYRLPDHQDFDLLEAARVLPYLHDLGVDWVYLSPLLASEPGSNHGYDVVRPRPHRPGARRRCRACRRCRPRRGGSGMGVLVDIVPNHVGVATPVGEPVVVGRARARPRVGVRRRLRHRLGGRWRPHRCIPVVGDDDSRTRDRAPRGRGRGGALPRPALPARARHDRPRSECTPAALRAGQLARGRRRPQLPPLLRRQHPGRDPGRGPRVVRRDPRRDRAAGSTRGSSTGCASTTPTACATPKRYLDDLAALTGGAYVLVEKILEPGEALPARLGHRRHHGLRRARADRPGAHRPGRRGAAGRARGPAPRRDRRLGADGPRQQARRRRRHPALRGPADHPRGRARAGVAGGARGRGRRRRRGRRAAGLLPGLPLLPARGPRPPRRRPSPPPASTGPTSPTTLDVLEPRALTTSGASRPGASSRPAAW